MGKLYSICLTLVLVGLASYVATENIRTERLLRGIRDAQAVQAQQAEDAILVAKAQDYARPLILSVQAMATENGALLERELQAAKTVNGLLEESNRLKVALKEAVTKLKELNEANNKALEEINLLQFKVQTLQSALDAITKSKEAVVPDVPITPPAPAPEKKSPKVKTNLSKVA